MRSFILFLAVSMLVVSCGGSGDAGDTYTMGPQTGINIRIEAANSYVSDFKIMDDWHIIDFGNPPLNVKIPLNTTIRIEFYGNASNFGINCNDNLCDCIQLQYDSYRCVQTFNILSESDTLLLVGH